MDTSGGRMLLKAVKDGARPDGPLLCIPVNRPIQALLRPVATRKEFLNRQDLSLLTEWRNRFVHSFLTEFQADENRTARWLTEMVRSDDTRILFMVDDALSGRTFGYMGLAFIDWANGSGEADAIVRGAAAGPGQMKSALQTML